MELLSAIRKSQLDNVINTSGREQHLRGVKSSDSSALAEKKGIVILSDSIIKHGYEISKKLQNDKVLIRSF